jgi:type IV pilus assembly protein PilF
MTTWGGQGMAKVGGPRLVLPLLLLLLAVLALGGCATTTVDGDGRPITRQEADVASPERRALVRLELAALYFGRGQADTALQEVRRAIAAKSDLPAAWSLQGLIYANLGDSRRAEDSFRRALQLAPRDGDVMHNYGWFLCQEQRWPEAQAQFAAALAVPQYRDRQRTLLTAGVCHARAGQLDLAEQALTQAHQIDPSEPTTGFNLADVLMRMGEYERARFHVARINAQPELVSAQSLWLAARIEHRSGQTVAARDIGRRLQERFPQSAEAVQFGRGAFNE